jgi:mannose-1-phosphate guanylyltransferase
LKPKNNLSHAYAVILAGGRGERFWPVSTARRPKQLLALTSRQPMLSEAVHRLQPLIPPERVIIVTNAELAPAIRRIMPEFPKHNIIGEPEGRNTAPAVALGAAIVRARDPEAQIAILTADHVIGDLKVFRQTLTDALELASKADLLITIGIPPTTPSTGFGYMEAATERLNIAGFTGSGQTEFYKVARFVEKPDRATAERYLQAGNFYWNAGMFVWSLEAFQKAAQRQHPQLTRLMDFLEPVIGKRSFEKKLAYAYRQMENISIDYALMEKADNIAMARCKFRWDDLGSWSAMEKHFKPDAAGNVCIGPAATMHDASRNVIVCDKDHLVALIGVEDLIVVQHKNTILICPKHRDQDVKQIVAQLKRRSDRRTRL